MSDDLLKIECAGHVHAMLSADGTELHVRCTDKRCAHARRAKVHGKWAVHVYDLRSRRLIRDEFVEPSIHRLDTRQSA